MKISIIIPALNEEGYLEKTLSHTLKLKGNFEIIVVDGGSTDHTQAIAEGFNPVQTLVAGKGRANQMNHGALHAKGEIFLFLHADTVLPQNVYQEITGQLRKPGHIGGSFRLRFDKYHPFLNLYSWCSRFNLEYFTYGDHAIFVKKEIYNLIGGFKSIPFMEDIEIQKRLRKKGKFKKLKSYVLTSGRRFEKNGIKYQLLLDVFLIFLYNFRVAPRTLKRFYKDHA
ncbi:TIGR04283 family arsenosugar biosynthesis glycosyltransferase [Gramella sp. AN32]|uniref:TIGR04283 family arsenosugar biosynthesis glycosyltransferase n=1 Tax=Christiangramia antarctica TaxID=2058158 RepID=A0ABW5X3V6_9FLAO|nr:TIGR04283 family arsenosugar biosynthesis glycosyltransferase [Gramella sp. AN32]MCM4157952.1 glycosyltransferase [Gramella sp. AN32]